MDFDLIQAQEYIKTLTDPEKLYRVWDKYLSFREKGQIGKYEIEELSPLVEAQFKLIESTKKALSSTTT